MISLFTKFFPTRLPLLLNRCVKSRAFSAKSSSIAEVNTKIVKDVILFSYENPRFFRLMNFFAISQYVFWGYFAHFCFFEVKNTPVKKDEISKDTPWYLKINLGDPTYRRILGTTSLLVGFSTIAITWMYTLRSVRYLVLHKGGNVVSFVTYTPFGHNRIMKVDLPYVSCAEGRNSSRVLLPIKVYNRTWYYLLDMRGEFRNPTLFDHTAGLKRSFSAHKK
ncbi:transmembrane protein 223 [Arctopsyche grandis]|uniref:transmembrane protein 223 n=1 Tax=Arctopsyche grandis TaxID=121162 RepID=UPI00406D7AA3